MQISYYHFPLILSTGNIYFNKKFLFLTKICMHVIYVCMYVCEYIRIYGRSSLQWKSGRYNTKQINYLPRICPCNCTASANAAGSSLGRRSAFMPTTSKGRPKYWPMKGYCSGSGASSKKMESLLSSAPSVSSGAAADWCIYVYTVCIYECMYVHVCTRMYMYVCVIFEFIAIYRVNI